MKALRRMLPRGSSEWFKVCVEIRIEIAVGAGDFTTG